MSWHRSKEQRSFTQACAGDDDLRDPVEKLLASYDGAGSFLSSPAIMDAGVIAVVDEVERNGDNDRIGPYEILREIGRGGMGTVFLAVRADDQYRKRVAIKLVNRGMDTDTIMRRFMMERQILANLEHPNIAGVTASRKKSQSKATLARSSLCGFRRGRKSYRSFATPVTRPVKTMPDLM